MSDGTYTLSGLKRTLEDLRKECVAEIESRSISQRGLETNGDFEDQTVAADANGPNLTQRARCEKRLQAIDEKLRQIKSTPDQVFSCSRCGADISERLSEKPTAMNCTMHSRANGKRRTHFTAGSVIKET